MNFNHNFRISVASAVAILLSACGGPELKTVTEPVLGIEKQQLGGYAFKTRDASLVGVLQVTCTPKKPKLNGTFSLTSRVSDYVADDNIKLFLVHNGKRSELKITGRSHITGEVGKQFFKSLRSYSTQKSMAFEMSKELLSAVKAGADVKIVFAKTVGSQGETTDMFTLYPDEFGPKHDALVQEFLTKCES